MPLGIFFFGFGRIDSVRERTKIILISIVTAAALAVFIVTLVQAYFWAPTDEIPLPAHSQRAYATSTTVLPSRLVIPALSIDANVQYVGVTATGNMATPHGFADVGWYKLGTIPGNQGSAVIAGHVDNGLGMPG